MTEQLGYPYVKGSHGIPFDELNLAEQVDASGSVAWFCVGGSGQILEYCATRQGLSISSGKNMMSAYVSEDSLFLDLATKTKGYRTDKHPDMFASKFVNYVLDYFRHLGVAINSFEAYWLSSSDNFAAFKSILEETADPIKAVKGTWSGQMIARHGFTSVCQEDITIIERDLYSAVRVIFKKDETTLTGELLSSPQQVGAL